MRTLAAALVIVALLGPGPARALQFPNPFGPSSSDKAWARRMEPAAIQLPARQHNRPSRVVKFRFWADHDFRSVTPAWKIKTRAWLSQLSRIIEPQFGVTFEAESFHAWDRPKPFASLGEMLVELQKKDPGQDVDWVVGLVTALPLVSTSIHAVAEAHLDSKFFVMRAMGNMNDARAVYANLGDIEPAKKEELYSRRILHKELVIFLHEWGHTLGAPHRGDSEDIMCPVYSLQARGFAPALLEVMRGALEHRLTDDGPGAAAPISAAAAPAPEVAAPVAQQAAATTWVTALLEKARQQQHAGDRASASASAAEAVERARVVAAAGDPIWLTLARACLDLGNLPGAEEALASAGDAPGASALRAQLATLRKTQRPPPKRRK